MLLCEMFKEYPDTYRDDRADQTVLKFGDTRKTKLTIAQINLLRRMNDQRMVEYAKHLEQVKTQYGATPAPAGL